MAGAVWQGSLELYDLVQESCTLAVMRRPQRSAAQKEVERYVLSTQQSMPGVHVYLEGVFNCQVGGDEGGIYRSIIKKHSRI
jgi:hypothetical protein